MTSAEAVKRNCEPLQVEDLYHHAKTQLPARPIHHSSNATTHGHVFRSIVALVLQKGLFDHSSDVDVTAARDDLIRDLGRHEQNI